MPAAEALGEAIGASEGHRDLADIGLRELPSSRQVLVLTHPCRAILSAQAVMGGLARPSQACRVDTCHPHVPELLPVRRAPFVVVLGPNGLLEPQGLHGRVHWVSSWSDTTESSQGNGCELQRGARGHRHLIDPVRIPPHTRGDAATALDLAVLLTDGFGEGLASEGP